MMKTAHTVNGQKMYNAILKMDAITFALVVGGYAHAEGDYSDGYNYVVSKWWKYCDEIATWILREDEATAIANYFLEPHTYCDECYSFGDQTVSPQVIHHDSDCSQG